MDRALLLAIIDKFDGGPVGLETLAAAVGEERDTIEDVYEPYLIQEGFLARTPRRAASRRRAPARTSGGRRIRPRRAGCSEPRSGEAHGGQLARGEHRVHAAHEAIVADVDPDRRPAGRSRP